MAAVGRRRLDRRMAVWVLASFLSCAMALGVCALETFKSSRIHVGKQALRVEMALTEAQREQGLMHREKLGADDGMLFVFDRPEYQSMWMKNTLIPLSVAFLDREGTILNIEEMQPQTLEPHMSAGPASYAIETNKGWFASHGLQVGDKATGLPPPK